MSPSHKEAMAAIIYGIEQKKGFIAIIGAVGVGKTTILRSYLEMTEKKHLKVIYVFNARLTFEGLLNTIYQDLGLQAESSDTVEMVNNLYKYLIDEYKNGNTVVLVIDEAQNMPIDTLESLRMLSNLETPKDKLIQIVLVGQPEFEDNINLHRLRQLKQRLAIRSTIFPLTKNESYEYIKFRLYKAGSKPGSVFTMPALKKIIKQAQGIPRVLNILCDNALITGYGYHQKPVTLKVVSEIIRDLKGSRRISFERWWAPAASLALIAIVFLLVWMWPHSDTLTNKPDVPASVVQKEPIASGEESRKEVTNKDKSKQTDPFKGSEQPKQNIQSTIQGKTQQTSQIPKTKSFGTQRTINRGDTLTKLAEETYGKADEKVLEVIKENNPQITDVNLIHAGSKIVLPEEVPAKK